MTASARTDYRIADHNGSARQLIRRQSTELAKYHDYALPILFLRHD
jgi:hypothetical protein